MKPAGVVLIAAAAAASVYGVHAQPGSHAEGRAAASPPAGIGDAALDPRAERLDAVVGSDAARLDAGLARARSQGQPAWIEFHADWCAACRVLERTALRDPKVVREANRFVTLRFDATDQEATAATLDRFGVQALPAIVFVSATGQILDTPRVRGAIGADALVGYLRQVR